jgi:hypothetical protein
MQLKDHKALTRVRYTWREICTEEIDRGGITRTENGERMMITMQERHRNRSVLDRGGIGRNAIIIVCRESSVEKYSI